MTQMFADFEMNSSASIGAICGKLRRLRQTPEWPKIVLDFGPPSEYIRIYTTAWCTIFDKSKAIRRQFAVSRQEMGQLGHDLACAKTSHEFRWDSVRRATANRR